MATVIRKMREPLFVILDELRLIGEEMEAAEASKDATALAAVKEREDALAAKLVAKVDRLADVLDHMAAQESVCRKRVREVERKARAWANQIERLRGYVLATMESRGITKLESETTSFAVEERWGKPKRTLAFNPELLPDCYVKKAADMDRIMADLNKGVIGDGTPGVTVIDTPAEPKKVLVRR